MGVTAGLLAIMAAAHILAGAARGAVDRPPGRIGCPPS